jgi:uncharacterized protein (TIGR01777 family)
MLILVSGASGLIGSALVPALEASGHRVLKLSRRPGGADTREWDPDAGRLDPRGLVGIDAVIHLAGENIAGGRWSAARKAAIEESRVRTTGLLARTVAALEPPPSAFVSASALGFYGDRGDERLDESSPPGEGFLADVCRKWEAATAPAEAAGVRTVHLRLGLVLTPRGGALAEMLLPFRLGLGGPLGPGRQWWSWITRDDVVGAFQHAVATPDLRGPVNGVAGAVTNRDFTRTLCRVLRRPMFLPVPRAVLALLLGEMADALLLASARVEPGRLAATDYRSKDPDLEPALRRLLARS